MAMLMPVEERPNTQMLLKLIQALQKYFQFNENEYQQFTSELLNHSPLNKEEHIYKNLNPSTNTTIIKI